jgi:hypothetical protein
MGADTAVIGTHMAGVLIAFIDHLKAQRLQLGLQALL